MDDFYKYLQNTVENAVERISIEDFKENSTLILGCNMLGKLEKLLNHFIQKNPDIALYFIGHNNHLEFFNSKWGDKYTKFLWEGRYSLEIIQYLNEKDILDNIDSFLFVSSNPINMRDINILEIAIEFEKYGIETYVYDYGLEELYKYKNLMVVKNGLELYGHINDFIDMTIK